MRPFADNGLASRHLLCRIRLTCPLQKADCVVVLPPCALTDFAQAKAPTLQLPTLAVPAGVKGGALRCLTLNTRV